VGSVLLAEGAPELAALVEGLGTARVGGCWHRRVAPSVEPLPEPPAAEFDVVLLRLPKSREESRMAIHLCLGTLNDNGRLIVYGGNDEGIRSSQKFLAGLAPVTVVATRGHGRVLALRRRDVGVRVRARLADWRETLAVGGLDRPWVSYPGLFAGGTLDPGTALVLAHLPTLAAGARVLDYGAGPGAIGAALRGKDASLQLTLLDNDSVALLAAAENAPGATRVLGGRLTAVAGQRFNLIVSNPPLHDGFKDDLGALLALIAEAPGHLLPGGSLLMVVQRRIALDQALGAAFGTVAQVADDGRYRVWSATGRQMGPQTGSQTGRSGPLRQSRAGA
jgi:16S rRNA (guanine1207-N2)-methyltransferase